MPAAPYGEDGAEKLNNFDFFPVPPITAVQRQQMDADAEQAQMPASKKKRELLLKYARAAAEMDRMLQKMGLLFFHGQLATQAPSESLFPFVLVRKNPCIKDLSNSLYNLVLESLMHPHKTYYSAHVVVLNL